jgi:AraC-like DNA-binding protein
MKPPYQQLDNATEGSFLFRQFNLPYFDAFYHFHPEFELTLILKGEGKRFVGNQMADFKEGDLVLLGSNVPHCWKSEGIRNENSARSIVIQFKEDFLGEGFFKNPDTQTIKNLLDKAKSGILISGKTRDRVAREMIFLLTVPPFQKLLGLLDLLNTIATSKDFEIIDNQPDKYDLPAIDLDRINKIYAYVIEHYTQDINLEAAARLTNMTETAFCRYFKKVTKKTFLDLVTEFRIKHVCNLLNSTDKQVAEVCFESGFGNISHFNKQFKVLTGYSPLNYRKMFLATI